MEVNMTGEEFKTLRLSKGLTQAKASKILGVSIRQIGNFEYGITPISDLYIEKIAGIHTHNMEIDVKNSPDLIPINYYPDVNTAAGYGAVNGDYDPETIIFPSTMLTAMFGITDFKG
jgi:transcriptional regulator with XRE-family HTH domain